MKYHPERALNSPHRIELLAAAVFAYAALFATEGVGLWLQKRWAEYLTVIATTSFIPFEIWEIGRDVSAIRVAPDSEVADREELLLKLRDERAEDGGNGPDARQVPLRGHGTRSGRCGAAAARRKRIRDHDEGGEP